MATSLCVNAISYNISLSIAVDKLPYICSLYYGHLLFRCKIHVQQQWLGAT